jgi:hypothetical protein
MQRSYRPAEPLRPRIPQDQSSSNGLQDGQKLSKSLVPHPPWTSNGVLSFMALRLSDADREQLQARREHLELELRLVTVTLRSDDALRWQQLRPADVKPVLRGRWREWVE